MKKDETDASNYDFEYTDFLVSELMKADCPPIFRLWKTIENAIGKGYKARYIYAPKDPDKWARIGPFGIRRYV